MFDRHLPERVPIPKARPQRGDLVARKGGSLTDRWRVQRVTCGLAKCVRPEGTSGAGDPRDPALDDLLVVRRFGEPIFPQAARQLVTIVINQKGVAQDRLSRAEE